MGQIWDAFTQSYKTEGISGAKTAVGGKAYAFRTGYDIGAEMKISGFEIGYVRRRSGLDNNQQVLAVLSNLKFQRYFINNGSLDLYNTYESTNARSRLLGKRINEWIQREGLKTSDVPSRASYQAANPAEKDTTEVLKHGGSREWIRKEGGEAKNIDMPSLPSLPSMPSLPSFKLPSIGIAGKGLIGVIVAIGVVIVMLIAIGYSGLGGAAGSHLEK